MSSPNIRFQSTECSDWVSTTLSTIADVIGGGTPSTSEQSYWNGDVQWFTPSDITSKYVSSSIRTISEEGVRNSSAKPLPKGSILFTSRATLGLSAINRSDKLVTTNQGFQSIIPKDGWSSEFVYYLVNQDRFLREVKKRASGSTFPEISPTALKSIIVNVPESKIEQQKIAEFFTALDEKIRCLDDLAKGFSQSMQGVLNKVFTQQISFKDENGNNYSEWTIKKIKDIAPLQRGFDLPTSQLQDGECTVIYSNGQTAKHSAFKCDGCAVVTGRSGTIGKVFYLDNCKYWPHNTTLWVTDFCGNNPKFIYYLFKFVGLERFSTGTGVPTLNRNDVHDYIVKIPSIDEQTKIVEFLDCYNKKLNLLISKKHAFHELKKAFMQRMFV